MESKMNCDAPQNQTETKSNGEDNDDIIDDSINLVKSNAIGNKIEELEASNRRQGKGPSKFLARSFVLPVLERSRIPSKDQELAELIKASNNDIYLPVSCQEYADNGQTRNGSYRVQPNTNISRKYIS